MGGIKTTAIGVECDVCKKLVQVTDAKKAAFYEGYARSKDQDDRMLVYAYTGVDGKEVADDFEFVCPKCMEIVSGALNKIRVGGKKKKKPAAPKKKPAPVTAAVEKKPEPVAMVDEPDPAENIDTELFGGL